MTRKYTKDEYDRFVTEHHPLIFSFLKYRQLEENDFYDVVVFGFMEAADEYLSKPELREKYSFRTIANIKMRDEVVEHYRKHYRRMRIASVVNIDAQVYSGYDV